MESDTDSTVPADIKSGIDACRVERDQRVREWRLNATMRRGSEQTATSDHQRMALMIDFTYTKSKIAQLFSSMPQAVLTGEGPYKSAAKAVEKQLNKRLKGAKCGAAIREVMPDVVSTAGIGGVMIAFEALTTEREVPKTPDELLSMWDRLQISLGLKTREMVKQPFVTSRKFSVTRMSPGDLLWPVQFKHSDFDEAPWLGGTGRMTWVKGKKAFKLKDTDKDRVVNQRKPDEQIVEPSSEEEMAKVEEVIYHEVYYWRHLYHDDEVDHEAIQRVVYVEGLQDPVINERWSGQRYDETIGKMLGARRYPVRVLTLDYLSDEAIPLSSSSISRVQVLEQIRGRQQMMSNRDHSKPMRWVNSDRVDPDIMAAIMGGDWQGIVPVQGDGQRILGEVARASYPREDLELDRVFKSDLDMHWGLGPNQTGTLAKSGEHSATEAEITQANFTSRIGAERQLVVDFFLGIADVMLGLMALYDDFELPTPEEGQKLALWDRERIPHALAFTVRGDATVMLDAPQRVARGIKILNLFGKAPNFKPTPIMADILSNAGYDPEEHLFEPQPRGPEPPNVSFRFSAEDLANPAVMALFLKSEVGVTREEMEAAKKAVLASQMPPQAGGGTPAPPAPPPPDTGGMQDARPDWQLLDRVDSRRDASQN